MPRYVAFLRGVSPQNARMPDLKRCFEDAGFEDVRTLLSSGNVVFSTEDSDGEAQLARRAEEAMRTGLERVFTTYVRSSAHLQELIDRDPFADFDIGHKAKRVVTFLSEPPRESIALPIEVDGARILKTDGSEAFTAYVPGSKGPVFMVLLERTFGKDITTRTLRTVEKCSRA